MDKRPGADWVGIIASEKQEPFGNHETIKDGYRNILSRRLYLYFPKFFSLYVFLKTTTRAHLGKLYSKRCANVNARKFSHFEWYISFPLVGKNSHRPFENVQLER